MLVTTRDGRFRDSLYLLTSAVFKVLIQNSWFAEFRPGKFNRAWTNHNPCLASNRVLVFSRINMYSCFLDMSFIALFSSQQSIIMKYFCLTALFFVACVSMTEARRSVSVQKGKQGIRSYLLIWWHLDFGILLLLRFSFGTCEWTAATIWFTPSIDWIGQIWGSQGCGRSAKLANPGRWQCDECCVHWRHAQQKKTHGISHTSRNSWSRWTGLFILSSILNKQFWTSLITSAWQRHWCFCS